MNLKTSLVSFLGLFGIINADSHIVRHLADAQQLQENVLPEDNSYRHKNIDVSWKGSNGVLKYMCHADCSGLIDALLEHSYGYTKEELQTWIGGKRRPLSKHYYDTIAAEKGFSKIDKLSDAKPGDFIAIKFPPDNEDTGHIMIIAALPQLREASAPIVEHTKQWTIVVIDSTTHGHGPTDTRYKAPKIFQEGIGKGSIRIYTDASNTPVGYTWSLLDVSEFKDNKDRPFVIGRLRHR